MVRILGNNQDSKWLFICGNEQRFAYDVLRASTIIKQLQGHSENNIYYFTDSQYMKKLLQCNNLSSDRLFSLKDVKTQINNFNDIVSVYCVVSSHGDIFGIEDIIKPNQLINDLSNIKGVTDGFILFGQCYSGIFNLINQSKLCIIGASNFYPSVSAIVENTAWSANVFLYYFFKWINNPIDVDCDNQCTIYDAYKWATYNTNKFLIKQKIEDSKTFDIWCTKEMNEINDMKKKLTIENKVDLTTKEIRLNDRLAIYHNQQESWISNIIAASRLII